jgi:hypothetical protein
MNKKTRFLILFICIILFFVITPYIVFYSLGYRFDFKNNKIIATGGIYVWVEQPTTEVIVDSKIVQKTGFFSNSVFVQNLLPKTHNILIKKDGYFDYQKNISVQEKEVAKLENITLFKNNIAFEKIAENADYFSISPNGNSLLIIILGSKNSEIKILNADSKTIKTEFTAVFTKVLDSRWSQDSEKILIKTEAKYIFADLSSETPKPLAVSFLAGAKEISFDAQNSNKLFFIKNDNLQTSEIVQNGAVILKVPEIILKKVLAYKIESNNILWLDSEGNLNSSDISGKITDKLLSAPLPVSQNDSYKIFKNWQGIMVSKNNDLLLLNTETKTLEKFLEPVFDLKISPDNQNTFYINNQEIWLNHSNYNYVSSKNQNLQKVLLNKFYEKVSDCFWLNNNYLILRANDKIKISEIDNRNNINIIDLPIKLSSESSIFFNQQDEKIYILTDGILSASEKLLP